MEIPFHKYEGTGNDFILVDNRDLSWAPGPETVARLCHRRFGIGADGLMLLNGSAEADFEMVYFNADGHPGSMCGNGGRCIALFARALGIVDRQASFLAIDGGHEARLEKYDREAGNGIVSLGMAAVDHIKLDDGQAVLDTGSPHFISFVNDPDQVEVVAEGRRIRNSGPYRDKGINVNFASVHNGVLHLRTYERGVEDETLSCGTGAVAAALAARHKGLVTGNRVQVETPGGRLLVSFSPEGTGYRDIRLEGPAAFVFRGTLDA